ncbi:MAG TPA: bifunctional tetrahydrofolate synthase/dihydrofolate synthase [Coxiellaceae bacterium]|nr:bifunctional tetrahydrofolate synthase/dihydrofolate synthase [Coxiellaceae bacterium]HBS51621.1 bifunctional tetrahydrofolate synthase/dihydrofolate synthase [Coxiellaceae bacterium]
MGLADWLQYLESLPSGLTNKSLDNVKNVANKLNLLNFTGKIITVVGTNGKGSCVVFLESILLQAGLKVGAYISPHLLHYNERIRLNGKDVDTKILCQAFATIKMECTGVILSYFEFTTLTALFIFKKQKPDVLLLEAGLGGRFDAVNILESDISIITTISLEHTQILGNTKEAIGYEKSGIMRSFKPVICGKNMPASITIAADNIQAKLYCLDRDFNYVEKNDCWNWQFITEVIKKLPLLRLPVNSAALALMTIKLLSEDFKISNQAIITGLKNAFLPGRWQRLIFNGKEIIFDVAHNHESATMLALNLNRGESKGRILAVVGMSSDKDIVATLKPLIRTVDRWYLGAFNNIRAASVTNLAQGLQEAGGTDFVLLPSITLSLQQAIAECQEKDRIAVFGSFYTVAEGLKLITS